MWILILSVSIAVAVTYGIIVRFLQVVMGVNGKLKKDDSYKSLLGIDELSTTITIHDTYSANAQDLRQRSIHCEESNQGRGQIATTDKVNGKAVNIQSNSIRWQKLNDQPSALSQLQLGGKLDSDTNFTQKAVKGLRGTKPLVTLNRFDLLMGTFAPPTSRILSDSGSDSMSGKSTPRHVSSPKNDIDHPSFSTMNLADLKLDLVIGGGGFGHVWRGWWNGTPVAVKILNAACQSSAPQNVISDFEDEANLLSRIRHPNICMFLGACLDPPNRAIVTELVSRGSLWELLRKPDLFTKTENVPDRLFHWPNWAIRKVFEGSLRGIAYLHKQNIIHRDLKSANLLLDDSFNVKICDFGLAKMKDFSVTLTSQVGTLQWMSPEVISGTPYDESTDIYSFGIVMWETLTGQCPFDGMTQSEIAYNVVDIGLRPPIPAVCNNLQSNLLKACWNASSSLRPQASQLLTDLDEIFQ